MSVKGDWNRLNSEELKKFSESPLFCQECGKGKSSCKCNIRVTRNNYVVDYIEAHKKDPAFIAERYKLQMSELFCNEMISRGIKQEDFCKHCDINPREMRRFMCGENNFNLKTLAKIFASIDCYLEFSLKKIE